MVFLYFINSLLQTGRSFKKVLPAGILYLGICFPGSQLISSEILDLDSALTVESKVGVKYRVTDYLYFYEDKTSQLSFDDICKLNPALFKKNQSKYPAFGFSKSAFWGKFTWKGQGRQDKLYLLFDYPLLDKIDLFIFDPVKKEYIKKSGGNNVPVSQKEIIHRKTIFILNPPGISANQDQEETIYFKVISEDTIELPILLLGPDALRETDNETSFFQGLYYGIILVMLLYNFFLFISVKDTAYLNYVIYLFSYVVVQYGIDGYLLQYVFPDNNHLSQITRIASANISMLFAARFADSFFNIKLNFPKLKYILPVFYTAVLLNAVLVFVNFFIAANISFVLLLFSVIIFLFFSLRLFNRYTPVRLYFFAWSMFTLGAFVWSLKLFDIFIPGVTPYAMQAGSVIEVTLLSFALGSRINLIKQEKDEIKSRELKQKQLLEKGRYQLDVLRNKASVIEKELSMARDIQFAMIPLKSPYSNIRSIYLPMEKIGGDFYDIIVLNEDKIGIFISDVSGHGIPAALITVMLKSIILIGVTELHREKDSSWLMEPDKFMIHMNNSLHGHLRDNFTTAFYGVYDKNDRSFKYSSASHPPPILLEYASGTELNFSFINVSPQAPPFGVYIHDAEKTKIGVNQITLPENSRLIMYSDGLMDNINYTFMNSETGLESFKDTILYDILKNSSNMNLQELLEEISIQLLVFRDMGLEDDVCVLVLEEKNGK